MRQFILALTMFASGAVAQQLPHYFTSIAGDGQNLRGAAAINDGAVGFKGKKADSCYKVVVVVPANPAERSGVDSEPMPVRYPWLSLLLRRYLPQNVE